jgi:putative inorganic carbon (hco3(-)) transporter
VAVAELVELHERRGNRRVAIGLLALGLAIVLLLILAALGAPRTMTLFAAAGVLGLGLLTRPRAATLLFVGVLYINLPVIAVQFYGVNSLVALGAPLLLLGIPFVSYLVIRRQPPVVTAAFPWMVAYLVVLLLSAAMSTDAEGAAESVASFATEGLVLYLLATNAIRDWPTLRLSVIVLLLVGAVLGTLSVYQEATQTYSNPYLGLAQTRATDPNEPVGADESERKGGPIGEVNRYAQIMLVLLPLAAFAVKSAGSVTGRLVAGAAGAAIFAGMLLTYSRGTAVAFVVLIGVAVAVRFVRLRHVALVGAVLVALVLVLAPRYVERVASLADLQELVSEESVASDGAIVGRATSNLASLGVFLEHPFFGVGPGRYAADFSQRSANELGLRFFEESRRAHSMPLEVAADTGLAGVVTLGGVFGATIFGLWRARRTWLTRDPQRAALATALILAVIGYLLTSLFLHIAYMRYLWLLMALANSAIWVLYRDARLLNAAVRRREVV